MSETNRYRTKEIRIKLSEEEYATIRNKSIESELTVSDAVRSLIVFGNINAKWLDEKSLNSVNELSEKIESLRYEINKIGNNINQIAYNTNSKFDTSEDELKEAYRNLIYAQRTCLDWIDEMRDRIDANNSYT